MRLPNLLIICNSIINSIIYVILNFYVLINLIFFKYEQIMFLIILKKHRKKSNNPYIELFSDINEDGNNIVCEIFHKNYYLNESIYFSENYLSFRLNSKNKKSFSKICDFDIKIGFINRVL